MIGCPLEAQASEEKPSDMQISLSFCLLSFWKCRTESIFLFPVKMKTLNAVMMRKLVDKDIGRKPQRQPHYFSQAASLYLPEGEMSESAVSALFTSSLLPPPPPSLLFNLTNSSSPRGRSQQRRAGRGLRAPEPPFCSLDWRGVGARVRREVKVNVLMASESETETVV